MRLGWWLLLSAGEVTINPDTFIVKAPWGGSMRIPRVGVMPTLKEMKEPGFDWKPEICEVHHMDGREFKRHCCDQHQVWIFWV